MNNILEEIRHVRQSLLELISHLDSICRHIDFLLGRSQVVLHGTELKRKVDAAVELLRRKCGNGRVTVLFSGGHDSTVALTLAVLAGLRNFRVLFIEVTGNTDWHNVQYVYKMCEKLGVLDQLVHAKRRDIDFWTALKKWGIPIPFYARWCLNEFKISQVRKYSGYLVITGVRRSESPRRGSLQFVDRILEHRQIAVNPVLDWTDEDIHDFMREYGIPENPCYDLFGHSGNCMFCPYYGKSIIEKTLRDPHWREKIVRGLLEANIRGKYGRQIAQRWLDIAKKYVNSQNNI